MATQAEGRIIQLEDERGPKHALATTNPAEIATAYQSSQAIAFEQAAYIMAERRPRDMDVVRQRLLKDCERPTFAETAIYRRPVGGGKVAQGLSIRFVEAALGTLGNVRTKRLVTLDDENRRKILIVVCDLESNTTFESEITIDKTVERRSLKEGQNPKGSRINSSGDRVYLVEATEDDLMTKESAIASKFIRQNGARIIPGWLQDECEQAIRATMVAKIKADPDHEKNKVVDAFDAIGIRVPDLKAFLGLPNLDSLVPKDLIALREVYQAIKDGETNWREVMEQREAARGTAAGEEKKPAGTRTEAVKDVLAKKVAPKAAEKPAEATATAKVEESTPSSDNPDAESAQEVGSEPLNVGGHIEPVAEPEPNKDITRVVAKVQDVERRKKGQKEYVLVTLHWTEDGSDIDCPVADWHKNTHHAALLASLGKIVDVDIKRNVKDEQVWYSLETIYTIGGEAFVPPAQG